MLIRDKLLEIIDLLENENTYFFGLRLLEDFGKKYRLDKYKMTIFYFYNNIELFTNSDDNLLSFKFDREIVEIHQFDARHNDHRMYIIKDLTELKDEIKNRIK